MTQHTTGRSAGRSRRALVLTVMSIATIIVLLALFWNQRHTGSRDDSAGQQRQSGDQESTERPGGPSDAPSFAVVGDSITEAGSPDINAADPGPASWTFYAGDGAPQFVGGWARSGATTADMAQNTTPMQADCLVILAGTNDVARDVPFDVSAANLRSIAARAGVPTVIVSAIPPFDPDPRAATTYNEDLVSLAADEGWTFTDPMAGIRTGDRFTPSMTSDGIHPTNEAARIIGADLKRAVIDATTSQRQP